MKALVALSISVCLSACSMMPEYQRPGVPMASIFPGGDNSFGGRHSSTLEAQAFFTEPRLRRIIDLALLENADLRVAVLKVEQSRAQYHIQRANLAPEVVASGGVDVQHTKAAGTSDQWSVGLGITSYELDLFGRLRSLNDQALQKFFETTEAQRSARVLLVSEVATQYFTLRLYEDQLALAKKTLAAVQDSYSLNKSSFEAGAVSELDLRTSETQVQNAKISVVTYGQQIAQADNRLVQLVGRSLPKDLPKGRDLSGAGLLKNISPGVPSELLGMRPDILEAEYALKAANADIGAARAAFFPTIKLTTSADSVSGDLASLLGSGTGVWSFAPKITVPIFNGGALKASLDVAKISERIEVANYQKAIQTAFREVSDALIGRRTYKAEILLRQDLVKAQHKRYELAMARYRQGVDNYLNVLSAQQDLFSAELELSNARFNAINSQVLLYKALGGGWQ